MSKAINQSKARNQNSTYWIYVEARTEVQHDGYIPVAYRLFLVKLDRRSALSELGAKL